MRTLLALLLLLPSLSLADQVGVAQFGYLNNNEAPAIIDESEAQDLLNVDVTPGGKSIKKREGYGLYKTLTYPAGIHGAHHFYDSSGNDVQIWASSSSLFGIIGDGTPTQLISSATLNATWDCADTQGFAYCVNSARNLLTRTNGATQTWYGSPLGTMIAVTPERLVISGVSGAANTLYFSEASNFTNFVTGITETSPFTEVIGSPGSRITHIEYGCGRVLFWKDESFGYVLGTDQTNLQIVTVSNVIGTIDNSSAIDPDGNVYFRAQDGHIYRYDCSTLAKLTTSITPSIQGSGNRTIDTWTQTSDTDFAAGRLTDLSTTTATGSLYLNYLSTAARFTTNWNAGMGTAAWTYTLTGGWSSPNARNIYCGASAGNIYAYKSWPAANGRWETQYKFYSAAGSDSFTMYIMANGASNTTSTDMSLGYGVRVARAFPNEHITIVRKDNSTPNAFVGLSTYTVTSDTNLHQLSVSRFPNGTIYVVRDSTPILSATDTTYSTGTYFGFHCNATSGGDIVAVNHESASAPENYPLYVATNTYTGTYDSAVKFSTSVTSWDTFAAAYADGGGSHTFYMRSSTNSFTVTHSTPSWSLVTPGAVISITPGNYFQVRDVFSSTTSLAGPRLDDFIVTWFGGTAADKAYATYFKDAVWWSVAYGNGQTTNNYIYRYDLLQPGWTLYNFGTGGFLKQNNNLYFGATASTGKIYRFGDATSDEGAAINAYWKSKDFAGPDPWLENEYTNLDVIARRDPGQSLSIAYALNGSTTTTTVTQSLSSTTDTIIRYKKLLPSGKIGGVVNVQVGDTSATSAWEVLGLRLTFRQLLYKPTQ